MLKLKSFFPCKGSVLVFSLVVLSFLLVAALSVAVVSVTERRGSIATDRSNRSFQVADSGIEEVLYKIYKVNDVETSLPPKYNNLAKLAEDIAGASCSNGKISKVTSTDKYTISFYFYDEVSEQDVQFEDENCDDPDWRIKITRVKSEGISGNTVRAVEVAVAALPLVIYTTENGDAVYQPDEFTVKKGAVVFFKNENTGTMKVCFDSGAPGVCSTDISQGNYWSYKFETLGTYNYHNNSEPTDIGKIIVE